MKDLLLGIDIGTTGTKCTFYSLDGSVAASAYREYPMLRPHPGWAEQDPALWWEAVCGNLRRCFDSGKVEAGRVAAVGVSCTNAVTLVDSRGEALCNALGLHDQRSSSQLEWLRAHVGAETVLRRTGNRLAKGSFALPRLKWLQENCPDAVERSYKFLTPGGYVIQHLTGEFVINRSRANLTLMADILTGDWAYDIVDAAGFPRRLLPRSLPACAVAGEVSRAAAEATGLLPGTPVAAGNVDTVAATMAAGAVEPGDMAITIGSSGRLCYISDRPILDERLLNCESPVPGRWTVIQTTDNAGVSLRWFRDVFGGVLAGSAQREGLPIYTALSRAAADTEPGAGGLIYLPYLSGEQSPIWDPDARGVFFGAGLGTGYGHFVRAVMEGVAFSLRDCLELVRGNVPAPELIPLGGGAANSPEWCQIFADVLNIPVSRFPLPETETLGDAITAAGCAGLDGLPFDFGKRLCAAGERFEPRPELAAMYDELFARYRSLYQKLRSEFCKANNSIC